MVRRTQNPKAQPRALHNKMPKRAFNAVRWSARVANIGAFLVSGVGFGALGLGLRLQNPNVGA